MKFFIWDFNISEIEPLKLADTVADYGALGNFSLSGFEMVLTRYVSTYIITYYLPSGGRLLKIEFYITNANSRSVCHCFLDLIPHSNGCYSWKNGSPGYFVPGARQHLQHRHHQHSQGGGSHCYRSLDVGLHSLCVRCFDRVSWRQCWNIYSLLYVSN